MPATARQPEPEEDDEPTTEATDDWEDPESSGGGGWIKFEDGKPVRFQIGAARPVYAWRHQTPFDKSEPSVPSITCLKTYSSDGKATGDCSLCDYGIPVKRHAFFPAIDRGDGTTKILRLTKTHPVYEQLVAWHRHPEYPEVTEFGIEVVRKKEGRRYAFNITPSRKNTAFTKDEEILLEATLESIQTIASPMALDNEFLLEVEEAAMAWAKEHGQGKAEGSKDDF